MIHFAKYWISDLTIREFLALKSRVYSDHVATAFWQLPLSCRRAGADMLTVAAVGTTWNIFILAEFLIVFGLGSYPPSETGPTNTVADQEDSKAFSLCPRLEPHLMLNYLPIVCQILRDYFWFDSIIKWRTFRIIRSDIMLLLVHMMNLPHDNSLNWPVSSLHPTCYMSCIIWQCNLQPDKLQTLKGEKSTFALVIHCTYY